MRFPCDVPQFLSITAPITHTLSHPRPRPCPCPRPCRRRRRRASFPFGIRGADETRRRPTAAGRPIDFSPQRSSQPLDLASTRRPCLRRRDERRRHGVNTSSLNTSAGVTRERAVRDIFDGGITLSRRLLLRAGHRIECATGRGTPHTRRLIALQACQEFAALSIVAESRHR